MTIELVLLSSAIVFAGFVVLGLTGFGSALIMVPLLMLFLDPKLVVPTARLVGVIAVIYLTFGLWKQAKKRIWLVLLTGSLIGTVIGTYGLSVLKSDLIRMIFAGVIILFALNIFFGGKNLQKPGFSRIIAVFVGMISGITGALFALSGPPVAWYLTRQLPNKDEFRATIVTYFSFSTLWGLVAYGYAGLLTQEVFIFSVYMLPAVAFGTLVGHVLHLRINRTLFRRVVAIILLVTSIGLLIK
ncbi:sulfite exporter TauE/SafE family protein [Planctomycetota bacterium]